VKDNKPRFVAISAATSTALAIGIGSAFAGASQSGEQKKMRQVGHVDLQGRSAYRPDVISHPKGKWIAFVGTHGGTANNPLKPGSPEDRNGIMIIDGTDPRHPKEKDHIKAPVGGQAPMVCMCLGKDLPGSRGVPAPNRRRVGQQMVIYDWNPSLAGGNAQPTYIRRVGGGRTGFHARGAAADASRADQRVRTSQCRQ
jgi:hypothetical protein